MLISTTPLTPISLIITTLFKNLFYNTLFLALLIFLPTYIQANTLNQPLPVVVISQIAQHISLDQERLGLIAALKEAGYENGKTMTLIYKNAEGNVTTSSQIASIFSGMKPTVAVAISTLSAQTLIKPMSKEKIPIVFTAVTDPIGAKLTSALEGSRSENVTGVSDALPIGIQIDLIKQFILNSKTGTSLTIGIIYNPGEINSIKAVEELEKIAIEQGIILKLVTATKSSEVASAAMQLAGKNVGAIFIPNDNTAVAAVKSIIAVGVKNLIPVFAADAGSVECGAIAAQAYDREALGRKAGALVVKILQGAKANDLAVETNHQFVPMINLESAKVMGISIPNDLMKQAKIIGEVKS